MFRARFKFKLAIAMQKVPAYHINIIELDTPCSDSRIEFIVLTMNLTHLIPNDFEKC